LKGRATCRQNFLPSGSSSQILPVVPPSFSSWSDVFPSEFITIIHLFLTYVRSRHLSQARPGQKIDPDEEKGRSSCRRQNYCVMLMFDAVALIGRHMLQSLADICCSHWQTHTSYQSPGQDTVTSSHLSLIQHTRAKKWKEMAQEDRKNNNHNNNK